MAEFTVGDVVVLKSGGAKMVVSAPYEPPVPKPGVIYQGFPEFVGWECVWLVQGAPRSHVFKGEVLRLAAEEPGSATDVAPARLRVAKG